MKSPPLQVLSAQLEALALRSAKEEYLHLNQSLFGAQLSCPRFTLSDSASRLGQWDGASQTLELSRELLLEHSWGVLVEVLKHEMAHQFVDQVLIISDQTSHGPAFRHVCATRGIDPSAAGLPTPSYGVDSEANSAIEKINRLLTLASSANEHEAQSAMNAAQRLMLRYNLDEKQCDADRGPSLCFRQLGTPTGRTFEPARILAMILSEHFFVEGIWVPVWRAREGKRGHVLEICGKLANVEIAAYAFDFLNRTAARLWREHQVLHGIRSNRDRRVFHAGVMSGFHDKLNRQKQRHAEEGLVWLGDPALHAYFKQRHPRARWTRSTSSQGDPAHAAGREAGSRIVLHNAMNAHALSRGHLLGPG